MKTASAAKVAAQFDAYLEVSRKQPVLITLDGKPVAVLLAVQDAAEAEQFASGNGPSIRSIFEKAHVQLQNGGGIPRDKFWAEVEQSRRAKRTTPSRGVKVQTKRAKK